MMPSSSTPFIKENHQYDVFLSFSGEDTRKNFVDHLYDALQRQGIHTFKDDERLRKGKSINDQLLKSIEDSKHFIIVFSKKYASSSWCLNELVKIMECQDSNLRIAYPIFYDVDPSEVRKQHGQVGEALAKHTNKETRKWREALTEVANLSGWDLRNTADGHEAKVIKLIVERISLELRPLNVNLDDNLVGMEPRLQDLHQILDIGVNDVRMIGIKGMGGAGKTTLTKATFDKLSIHFEAKSFVENVREVSKESSSGLLSLQRKIISDLLNGQGVTVSSVYDGTNMIKTMLCGRKVLLVLDDVDHKGQLDALAGDLNWFKPGSRILITTRDEQVLVAHRVKWIHDVNLLSDEEAICLFSRYAFGKDIPVQEYEKQSLQVVRYAAGLPLTIKVLGSFLCGKDKPEWIDALARLRKIPLKETLEILELSYESLEDDYKEIFLDIACLTKGWQKKKAIRMLEGCGFHAINCLRVLEQRCLITFSDLPFTDSFSIDLCMHDLVEELVQEEVTDISRYQMSANIHVNPARDNLRHLLVNSKTDVFVRMHDHIEEMGKNVVRRLHPDDPNKHSRLWIQEEIEDVLSNDLGTEATRCINLKLTPEIVMKGLGNMKKLRCLIIDHNNLDDDLEKIDEASQYFPNALRYLSWSRYPHWCLPETFQANNLVALEMSHSRIEQLWVGGKVMEKLKYLELTSSKLSTLDLGLTPNLVRLNLQFCFDLVELYVPDGGLKRLVELNLVCCKRLKSVSFIKELESLEDLNLDGLNLKEFPDIIPSHSNSSLQVLRFGYNGIENLPSSIGNLYKLVYLSLRNCRKLKRIPGSICSLQHLKVLDLEECGIEELPEDICKLRCLEKLDLSWSKVLNLPDSICMLKHLKTLLLTCCGVLEKLPEDLGQLESLEELNLEGCCQISEIPSSICKLKHLKELNLSRCYELEKLPENIGDLECLRKLNLKNTPISHLAHRIPLLKDLRIVEAIERSNPDPLLSQEQEPMARASKRCCNIQ